MRYKYPSSICIQLYHKLRDKIDRNKNAKIAQFSPWITALPYIIHLFIMINTKCTINYNLFISVESEEVLLFNDESESIIEMTKPFVVRSRRHGYLSISRYHYDKVVDRFDLPLYYLLCLRAILLPFYKLSLATRAQCNVASDFNFETEPESAGGSSGSYVGRQSEKLVSRQAGKHITPRRRVWTRALEYR